MTGSPRVEDNQLLIGGSGIPPSSFGYFLVSRDSAAVNMPAGSAGILCLGGAVGRYDGSVLTASPAGLVQQSFDLGAIPSPVQPFAASSGDTLYFQYWFRDSTSSGSPTSNFSSGVQLDFACDGVHYETAASLFPLPWTSRQPVTADFNGDGLLDLAIVAEVTDEIAVATQLPGGGFAPATLSPIGSAVSLAGIAPADVDLDGDVDLFAITGGELFVYLNDGSARFVVHASVTINTGTRNIQVSDLDRDGLPDAIVGRQSNTVTTVFMGPGGVPALRTEVQTGILGGHVRVGDLNGDSLDDILLTGAIGSGVVWLRNLGNRSFALMTNLPPVPGALVTGELLDLDADGDLDLWFRHGSPVGEGTMLNDGAGQFVLGPGLGLSLDIRWIAVRDLDVDGDDDLLILGEGNGELLTVVKQTAPGVFRPLPSTALPFAVRTAVLADFGGDGSPDFAGQEYPIFSEGGILLPNDGSGTFSVAQPLTVSATFESPLAVDWNADGLEDVLYGDSSGVGIIANVGSTAIAGAPVPGAQDPAFGVPIAAVDLDGDGRLDILTRSTGALRPLIADGSGGVTPMPEVVLAAGLLDIVTGDFTGDGLPDIVQLDLSSGVFSVRVDENTGGGSFGPGSLTQIAASPTRIAPGDIDGDGFLDLVALSESTSELKIFLNDGGGAGFTETMSLPIEASFSGQGVRPVVADFDSDGDLDIAVAQRGLSVGLIGIVTLFENAGGGSFMGASSFWPGFPPSSMMPRDMDRDGYTDLVFSRPDSPVWTVLLNDPAGGFVAPSRWLGIGQGVGVLPVDITGDGTVDILTFRASPAAVAIHPGRCD